jgi:hypothetical protein
VTHLRQMMVEELQRRNYSKSTTRYYLQAVTDFARHFGKSPDKLGADELRSYQAYLLRERKLAVGTVIDLGRYTHRVAISNHRLLTFEQERVTFRWKDYAHGGKQSRMTLAGTEFLRRFFLHVLPRGFVRIRHFGFLANRFRLSRLALCRQLLACSDSAQQEVRIQLVRSETSSLWHCPRCGASMILVQRFTAAELSACTYFDSS